MPARRKHVPQRTCAGCRETQAKRALLRIVRTPDGVEIDPTGKKAGRGVYVHNDPACWRKGIEGAIAKALKIELSERDRAMLEEYAAHLTKEE
ncbi:MAG: YlxR family protein [Anaerolineae bacterium]|jgi:predicted RNA-binding protein YlxR (DUF448 family)|nr:YlxR family protein [Anaerolineae bacterium]